MAIGGKKFPIKDDVYGNPTLFIELTIKKPDDEKEGRVKAIIETGSDFTYLNRATIEMLNLRRINTNTEEEEYIGTEDAHGHVEKDEFYLATVKIDDIFEETIIVGMRSSHPAIGMDIITKLHLIINGPFNSFELANQKDYNVDPSN